MYVVPLKKNFLVAIETQEKYDLGKFNFFLKFCKIHVLQIIYKKGFQSMHMGIMKSKHSY